MTWPKKDNNKYKDHDKHMNLCEVVDISDSWEPEFTTVIVTWQLRVTLDSIRNSCDVFSIGWDQFHTWNFFGRDQSKKSPCIFKILFKQCPNPHICPPQTKIEIVITCSEQDLFESYSVIKLKLEHLDISSLLKFQNYRNKSSHENSQSRIREAIDHQAQKLNA